MRSPLLLTLATVVALGCSRKEPPKDPSIRPVVCGAFEFRAEDDEQINRVRMLFYQTAIGISGREFRDLSYFGTGDVSARFIFPAGWTTFHLSSRDNHWVEKNWIKVSQISSRRNWEDTWLTREAKSTFAVMKDRLLAKWPVADVDLKNPDEHFFKPPGSPDQANKLAQPR